MMIMLEGLFRSDKEGNVWVDQPYHNGDILAITALLPNLVGHHVQFAMHQTPVMPFDSTLRGLGSCHVEGICPCGHDDGYFNLYNIVANGTLRADPWRIEQFDGTTVDLRLDLMVGHDGRLACASITELEKMREAAATLAVQVQAFSIGTSETPGDK